MEKWMIRGMVIMIVIIFLYGFVWPIIKTIVEETG